MNHKPLLILNASAGSGKTHRLVHDMLYLCLRSEDPSSIRWLLAMTFTVNAAQSMKQRMVESLVELAQGRSSDYGGLSGELGINQEELQKRAADTLTYVLHHYSQLSIKTIDSFLSALARSFAVELDLDPNATTELDTDRIAEEVVEDLLSQVGEGESPEITRLMVELSKHRLEEDKSWDLSKALVDVAKGLFNERQRQHIDALADMSHSQVEDAFKEIRTTYRKLCQEAKSMAEGWLEEYENSGIEEAHVSNVNTSIVGGMRRLAIEGDFLKEITATQLKQAEEGTFLKKKFDHPAVEGLCRKAGRIFERLQEIQVDLIVASRMLNNAAATILSGDLAHRLNEIQKDNEIITLNEISHKLNELVENDPVPFIYERFGVRYKHFLLDEFQDTSVFQMNTLAPLLEEGLSKGQQSLIVGDGKQAIYRFRNGMVEQFIALPALMDADSSPTRAQRSAFLEQSGQKDNLPDNWRSGREIVQFNNDLFSFLSQELPAQYQPLYDGLEQNPQKKFDGGVYIEVLDEEEDGLEWIMAQVRKMQELGYDLADIAILTKKNKRADTIAAELQQNDIPCISPDSLKIGENPKVKLLISCMRCLENPRNREAASTLFHEWSLQHQRALSISRMREKVSSKEGVIDILRSVNVEPELAQSYLSLHSLCMELCRRLDIDHSKDPYLQAFLSFIREHERMAGQSITRFLDKWDQSGHKLSLARGGGQDAVTVMTNHKSKGLQFPVVIADLKGWAYDNKSQARWYEVPDSSIPFALVSEAGELERTPLGPAYLHEKHQQAVDEMNLLYVTMTRPQERLLIAAAPKNKDSKANKWFEKYMKDRQMGEKHCIGEPFAPREGKKEETSTTIDQAFYRFDGGHFPFCLKPEPGIDLSSEQLVGSILHEALALHLKGNGHGSAFNRWSKRIGNAPEIFSKVEEHLEKALADQRLEALRTGSLHIAIEQDLVDSNGQLLRPDAVFMSEDKLVVVDFKTGESRSSYHKQLEKYGAAMADIHPGKEVEMWLYFPGSGEWESVGKEG